MSLMQGGMLEICGEELLPPDCKPLDSDQIIQLQLRIPAFPRGLELLLHKAGIVFLALSLERLLQSEQRTWVARVVVQVFAKNLLRARIVSVHQKRRAE